MKRVLFIASFVVLAGCFSIDRGSSEAFRGSRLNVTDGEPMEHVVVSNYGWFLFDTVPVVCGNAKYDATLPVRFFSDHVKADILQDRITEYAAGKKADLVDLHYFHNSNVLFSIPGLNLPIPIPYVLCYREIQFSGVLVRPPLKAANKGALEGEMRSLLNEIGEGVK